MSVRIQYAYLKQQCRLYRRNYPKALQPVLGGALKQSLKTGDARVAKARAAEVNAKYEEIVAQAEAGVAVSAPTPVGVTAPAFSPVVVVGKAPVATLAQQYLNRRSNELRHGGFKSVRFSVGLFVSAYGARSIGSVSRDDALEFTRKVAQLGCHVGKSYRRKGASLDRLVEASEGPRVSAVTQRRTIGQVSHFLDWAVYEGQLASYPFRTVRVGITRKGAVFHSTRKWFVTQCERAGGPEHWTDPIVGHQSARSENRMTYGIYSAGISDHQKREIVETVHLPWQ